MDAVSSHPWLFVVPADPLARVADHALAGVAAAAVLGIGALAGVGLLGPPAAGLRLGTGAVPTQQTPDTAPAAMRTTREPKALVELGRS